ncbi:MAG TPA: cytochrome P450 [Acidimicrobiales bacterium]|nr:cytochrome P450 [Acidimicrobiales bacterium]
MESHLKSEAAPTQRAARLRAALVTPGLMAFLGSSRIRDHPHRAYRLLQRRDPIHRSPFGFWVLSRHAEVSAALRHPGLGVDPGAIDPALLRIGPLRRLLDRPAPSTVGPGAFLDMSEGLLLFRDPPDHTRLRGLVSRAFTPRQMARLEGRIAELTADLLAPLRHRRGRFDLMAELAYPLPARVICELIGLPPEDHELIATHGQDLAVGLDPLPSGDELRRADRAVAALRHHLAEPIRSRRAAPRDDLLSALVQAEADGDRLDHDELVATVVLLLIAGHETTANLIGNAVALLDRHPDQRQALRDRPELAETAVDELLRYEPPVQMTQRNALVDVELAGRTIPAGSIVILLTGAANRDPDVFPDPRRLDLARTPNPHLAFGGGAHFCLGAALARMEGRIALPALYRALPGLRVAGRRPTHRSSFVIRGYGALPVELAR